jgi:hypothetical protein
MTMGFKYQLLRMTSAHQVVQITLQHLTTLKKILESPAVDLMIDAAIREVTDVYSRLPQQEFLALRYTLLRFFQDRKVKVSLFLQDGIQNLDGTIVLDFTGVLPPGTDVPGTVKYFEPNSGGRPARTERLAALEDPSVHVWAESSSAKSQPQTLGENLYAKERKTAGASTAGSGKGSAQPGLGPEGASSRDLLDGGADITSPQAAGTDPLASPAPSGHTHTAPGSGSATDAAGGTGTGTGAVHAESGGQGRAALDLLSSLLGSASTDATTNFLPLTLFAGDDTASGGSGTGGSSNGGIVTFDLAERSQYMKMLEKARGGLDVDATAASQPNGDDDDLLSMMDAAANL